MQIWFSPSFPAGSFAYSQGLEGASDAGLVTDEGSLLAWIGDLFRFGSISNDLVLLACVWKAAGARKWQELSEAAEFGAALQPSAERRLEASTQGASFLEAICAAWTCANLTEALEHCCEHAPIPYAVAAGLVSAAHGLHLCPTLEAFALAFASAQISAGIRLGVIGQTAGQRIVRALLPIIGEATAHASAATFDEIGSASFSADLLTLEHESQYTRLFRT